MANELTTAGISVMYAVEATIDVRPTAIADYTLLPSIKEIPELNKGKGVILQRYKDGTLSDIITFNLEDGISWKMNGGRQRVEKELMTWQGKRGGAGKMVPNGFPKPPLF